MTLKIQYQCRVAMRVLAVLARHEGAASYIGAFKPTIGVSAQTLIDLQGQEYAAAQVNAANPKVGESVESLISTVRGWTMVVRNRVPSLPHHRFGHAKMVPEDALARAANFVKSIDAYEAVNDLTLDFSQKLREEVGVKMAAVESALADNGGDQVDLDALQEQLAEVSARFHSDLILFRKAIAALVGKTHPDYRRLKARRTGAAEPAEDEEDEEDGKAPLVTVPASESSVGG